MLILFQERYWCIVCSYCGIWLSSQLRSIEVSLYIESTASIRAAEDQFQTPSLLIVSKRRPLAMRTPRNSFSYWSYLKQAAKVAEPPYRTAIPILVLPAHLNT